jgi:hypothetical protein
MAGGTGHPPGPAGDLRLNSQIPGTTGSRLQTMQNSLTIYLAIPKTCIENVIILDPLIYHSRTGTGFDWLLDNSG